MDSGHLFGTNINLNLHHCILIKATEEMTLYITNLGKSPNIWTIKTLGLGTQWEHTYNLNGQENIISIVESIFIRSKGIL
jgi:hypothetical protein